MLTDGQVPTLVYGPKFINMPANNSFSISFTSYGMYDGNAEQKFYSMEEFDIYYDNVIEPQIISLLKEKGLLIEDIKDIEDDPNTEYDDSLICLDNAIHDMSFSENIVDQHKSLKEEIDEVLLDEKSSPIIDKRLKQKINEVVLEEKSSSIIVKRPTVKLEEIFSSYTCGKCDKLFSQIEALKKHKSCACEECGKLFSKTRALKK